jgi:hypothetical protein
MEKREPNLVGLLERAACPPFPIEDENRPISQFCGVINLRYWTMLKKTISLL